MLTNLVGCSSQLPVHFFPKIPLDCFLNERSNTSLRFNRMLLLCVLNLIVPSSPFVLYLMFHMTPLSFPNPLLSRLTTVKHRTLNTPPCHPSRYLAFPHSHSVISFYRCHSLSEYQVLCLILVLSDLADRRFSLTESSFQPS